MSMEPPSLVACADPEELDYTVESYSASGFRTKPWRQGILAIKWYYGTTGWHIFWAILTWGIGNALYLLRSLNRSQRVYIRLALQPAPTPLDTTPEWVKKALAKNAGLPPHKEWNNGR